MPRSPSPRRQRRYRDLDDPDQHTSRSPSPSRHRRRRYSRSPSPRRRRSIDRRGRRPDEVDDVVAHEVAPYRNHVDDTLAAQEGALVALEGEVCPINRQLQNSRRRSAQKERSPSVDTSKQVQDDDDEETKMAKLMGFGGFDTTKNKKVPGADVSAVNVKKPMKYRQYMNRRGGFNRPLDN
ncbi:hypothetical protein [Absidia glauca]|uniref:U4/U6.U5 small nuclear ribonucleoprotein 27kDa protein domain-containing protein n=1 Tax=Absidia glauca TaxID=4829 RepID=A0A168QVH5_ABSGL|nr:hypothetical protein [Absidia glauca]